MREEKREVRKVIKYKEVDFRASQFQKNCGGWVTADVLRRDFIEAQHLGTGY